VLCCVQQLCTTVVHSDMHTQICDNSSWCCCIVRIWCVYFSVLNQWIGRKNMHNVTCMLCGMGCKTFNLVNKKHLKNVGPIHHCEPPHAHSPDVASSTVARRLRIDVHDNANDNDKTTTTTRDKGDRCGPMEWAQSLNDHLRLVTRPICSTRLHI